MRLQVNPEKCTGCGICELFCSFEKERAVWPAKSRVSVLKWEKQGIYVPFMCQQCERAVCREVCPVQAISRNDDTLAYEVDAKKCLGCKMCVTACPFGGVAFDHERGQAIKCDLCGGDPECARLCPTGAITFAKDEKFILVRRRQGVEKLVKYLDLIGR